MSKVAIITGGNRGIGRATASRLARMGFDIGITYRDRADEAEQTVADIHSHGHNAQAMQLDLRDIARIPEVIDALSRQLGGLHTFVNNAAINPRAPFSDLTFAELEEVVGIDLLAPVVCAQAAARRMLARGTRGRIINVTSVLAHAPVPGALAYSAAKAGLEAATKVMALELASAGIAVNAVAVGHTATAMNGFPEGSNGNDISRPTIPFGRPASPQEIAASIAFFASPDSTYFTGSTLTVDGGLLLVQGPTLLEQSIKENA